MGPNTYGAKVIGERVAIQCLGNNGIPRLRQGEILEMKVSHKVAFENGGAVEWFDLAEIEQARGLTWITKEPVAASPREEAGQAPLIKTEEANKPTSSVSTIKAPTTKPNSKKKQRVFPWTRNGASNVAAASTNRELPPQKKQRTASTSSKPKNQSLGGTTKSSEQKGNLNVMPSSETDTEAMPLAATKPKEDSESAKIMPDTCSSEYVGANEKSDKGKSGIGPKTAITASLGTTSETERSWNRVWEHEVMIGPEKDPAATEVANLNGESLMSRNASSEQDTSKGIVPKQTARKKQIRLFRTKQCALTSAKRSALELPNHLVSEQGTTVVTANVERGGLMAPSLISEQKSNEKVLPKKKQIRPAGVSVARKGSGTLGASTNANKGGSADKPDNVVSDQATLAEGLEHGYKEIAVAHLEQGNSVGKVLPKKKQIRPAGVSIMAGQKVVTQALATSTNAKGSSTEIADNEMASEHAAIPGPETCIKEVTVANSEKGGSLVGRVVSVQKDNGGKALPKKKQIRPAGVCTMAGNKAATRPLAASSKDKGRSVQNPGNNLVSEQVAIAQPETASKEVPIVISEQADPVARRVVTGQKNNGKVLLKKKQIRPASLSIMAGGETDKKALCLSFDAIDGSISKMFGQEQSIKPATGASETASVTPERAKMPSQPNNDWINDMHKWMLNTPHGVKNQKVSETNAKCVINRVKDLASGRGISYVRWKKGVRFYGGKKVDLSFDFSKMLEEAKKFEKKHGEDVGHGWVLTHPIKKLQLYKLAVGKINSI